MKLFVLFAAIITLTGCAIPQIQPYESVKQVDRDHRLVESQIYDRAKSEWSQKYTSTQDRITVSRETLSDGSVEISALRWNPDLAGTILPFVTVRVSPVEEGTEVLIQQQRPLFYREKHIYLDQVEEWLTQPQEPDPNTD